MVTTRRSQYETLRPITAGEIPSTDRDVTSMKALARMLADLDHLANRWKALAPATAKKAKRVRKRGSQSGRMIAGRADKLLTNEQIEMLRYPRYEQPAFNAELYQSLSKWRRHNIGQSANPDVDRVSSAYVSPGQSLVFEGTCFGPPQGKVQLQITSTQTVELEVSRWTDTSVEATLSSLLTGLRPYYGRVWIVSGDARTSNSWPVQFRPNHVLWCGGWLHRLGGGVFGDSENGTAFAANPQISDADFYVWDVRSTHSGDGWSSMQEPYASGRSVAQGYHMGVGAFGTAEMQLIYWIAGPMGIAAPLIPGLDLYLFMNYLP